MAAAYTDGAAIKTWTPLVDGVDYPEAVDLNSAYDEITAIQTVLGIAPQGSAATVLARLAVSLTASGALRTDLTPTFAWLHLDGNLKLASGISVVSDVDDGLIMVSGGSDTDTDHGAYITLIGNDYAGFGGALAGCMLIKAGNKAAGGRIVFDTAGLNRLQIDYLGQLGVGVDPAGNAQSLFEVQGGLTTVGSVVTLATKETTVVLNDVLGRINFNAPLEASGTDALLVGASIAAIAEDTFAADCNKTSLVFQTGASEAAITRMIIDSSGGIWMGSLLEVDGLITANDGISISSLRLTISCPSAHSAVFASNDADDVTVSFNNAGGGKSNIACSGQIKTVSDVLWDFGAYVAGAGCTPDGYVTVAIGAATYRIPADLQA